MATPISIPKLGLTMTKATVVKWLKNEGDLVKKGDAIVQIETDKVTNKIESPDSGILLKILAQPKTVVSVGTTIGFVGQVGEAIPAVGTAQQAPQAGKSSPASVSGVQAKPSQDQTPPPIQVRVSPRAKQLVAEKGIDTSKILGSGPNGMIMENDVLDYVKKKLEKTDQGLTVKQLIPLSPTRMAIANNMVSSLQSMAQVTLSLECSAEALKNIRIGWGNLNAGGVTSPGAPTYTDMLVKVAASVLKNHGMVNSTMEEDQIKVIEEINIGVAVAAETGLIVPVIRDADKKTLDEISNTLKEMIDKSRKGELTLSDVTGGTFTITNLGTYGIDGFTPIINPPQSAILGVGQIRDIPKVVEGGQVRAAPSLVLSLTFDHRVMDGHVAASFLKALKDSLEAEDSLKDLLVPK